MSSVADAGLTCMIHSDGRAAVVELVRGDTLIAVWPAYPRADLRAVDQLARLARAARLAGLAVRLRNPAPDLTALIEFCGLSAVVTSVDDAS
jgi:hypothetical protein